MNEERVLTREAKVKLLSILQAGRVSRDDAREISRLLDLPSLTLEIIDKTEQVIKHEQY